MSTPTLQPIKHRILVIRRRKVMVDLDVAEVYGVTTKRLNEQVKRNRDRFPEDFMFQLTAEEKAEVVANCDHLQRLKFSPQLPHAFTEHGALMLASVLSSPVAIQASIEVVRAFVRLRSLLAAHVELAQKLAQLEKKYDAQFKVVFDAIRGLMAPPAPARRRIGFDPEPSRRAAESAPSAEAAASASAAGAWALAPRHAGRASRRMAGGEPLGRAITEAPGANT